MPLYPLGRPQLSKMAWLPFWQFLLQLGFVEAITDSCVFGSIHRKPFRWLGYGLDMASINARCTGGHQHVKIEGQLTKASAIYHPGLADFIADKICAALKLRHAALPEPKPVQIESVVLNDVLMQEGWKTIDDWHWRKPAHINVLESNSVVKLFHHLVQKGGRLRFCALLDSRVAKGAHGKGRSSARALRPSLLRGCALAIAGNLHPAYGFAPTRLNTADAPTRNRLLPEPALFSILDFLSERQVASLHSRQFSRATAGWVRLYILVAFCLCPGHGFSDSSPAQCLGFWTYAQIILPIIGLGFCLFLRPLTSQVWTSLWSLPRGNERFRPKMKWSLIFRVVFASLVLSSCAMPMQPSGTGEAERAERRSGVVLQADRVVLQQTRDRREILLTAFDTWLAENCRTTLEALLEPGNIDYDEVAEMLVAYGKDMYQAGKSYGRFSDAINAVTANAPACDAISRLLGI